MKLSDDSEERRMSEKIITYLSKFDIIIVSSRRAPTMHSYIILHDGMINLEISRDFDAMQR